ncbi:glutathionyl-hydroquinone reductase YqjG-like isoform X2 [Glandiceps talaboti]
MHNTCTLWRWYHLRVYICSKQHTKSICSSRRLHVTSPFKVFRSIEHRRNMSTANDNSDKVDSTDIVKSWTSSISKSGEYIRKQASFRQNVTADGSSGFKAEANRYHLYVSYACPWAHRTLISRKLKGLEDVISFTVVDWLLGDGGWNFTDKKPGCTLDPINGAKFLKEIYLKANPDYAGNITVPVLWDKTKKTIVNNESSEIIRMFNNEFNEFCATDEHRKVDLYPKELREKIDEVNDWVYPNINNGVYRAGFARSQEAYDVAVRDVFTHLDKVNDILEKSRYLTGDQMTEADVRLFTTLIRFDPVYVGHFKCNKKRIMDYPTIWGYVRDIYQTSCVAETVNQEHIQKHYQQSHIQINPFGIVAIGPELDYNAPHDRDKVGLGKAPKRKSDTENVSPSRKSPRKK